MKSIPSPASLIMRTSRNFRYWLLYSLCSAAGALSVLPTLAEAQGNKDVPPNLQKLDEGNPGDITIKKPESNLKTFEKHEQGVVTDVQVQAGKSNYHLKQSAGAGNAAPGDAQGNSVHPAQWQIKEFDWGRKGRDAKPPEGLQEPAAPPPAPK